MKLVRKRVFADPAANPQPFSLPPALCPSLAGNTAAVRFFQVERGVGAWICTWRTSASSFVTAFAQSMLVPGRSGSPGTVGLPRKYGRPNAGRNRPFLRTRATDAIFPCTGGHSGSVASFGTTNPTQPAAGVNRRSVVPNNRVPQLRMTESLEEWEFRIPLRVFRGLSRGYR